MGELWGGVRCKRTARWELRLVGVVELRETARTRKAPAVGSRKARTLLALLGTRKGQLVGTDEIVDVLWEGDPPRQPEANMATLVSRLRARFGRDAITGGRAGYRLGETVQVDLDEAAALVAEAETLLRYGDPSLAVVAAEGALDLVGRGPVLAEHPAADWAEQARARQSGLLRRARLTTGDAALDVGDPAQAHLMAEAAIAADLLDEAAYRLLMRACTTTGEPARAIQAYQRLREALATELGTDPAPATHQLYLAALRGNRS